MAKKLYSTLYKSIVRAVGDMVKDIQSTDTTPLEYWDWENRVDEDQMPPINLVGVNGFHFDENRGQWIVQFGITLSTVNDDNLLHEADLIDVIHETFGYHQKIQVLDPNNGDVINELVSVDFEVMPMGQTQVRNYRPIGIELRITGT